ncbi:Aldehyde dehydrogenase 3I1 isoform 2 [Hibiscus syriacus]|uniref:Aldehyde dehydrogenase 3I1 isoform 2 n=1 Tax=Hibiscus syriacus TaxID=106335 RepID=A0A6A2ZDT4_HIBSY|nr:Aldehyde dehydrogenase 3I1 isoform 2 [Hibiscus syriacus]
MYDADIDDNLSIVSRNCVRTSWSCLGHIYLELPFLYMHESVRALSLEPVIGAIAAGNAVVLKPSEIAPATSLLLSRYLYISDGARVGHIVMAAAAKNLTPVTLELGGKCPAVGTSKRIVAGKWVCNNGQVCIGVDYIITTKEFAPKALVSAVEEKFGKDPMESKERSRIINLFHFSRLVNLLDEDKVERLEDSFAMINQKPKPLASYLFSDDEQIKREFVQNVYAGGMAINETILQHEIWIHDEFILKFNDWRSHQIFLSEVTVPSLPVGGVGESGMGTYDGKFSFDTFSHKKAVLYRSFSGESPTRYPPYTPEKQKQTKANQSLSGNIFKITLALLGWFKDRVNAHTFAG